MTRAGMADLFAKRRRRVPPAWRPPSPLEIELQKNVARLLKDYIRPDWRFTHPASGEKREPKVAAKLKAMGVMRGWPDFVLVAPTRVFHGLELKRAGGVLSDDQLDFQSWAQSFGIPYEVCFDLPGVLEVLGRWGCLRVHIRDGVVHLGEAGCRVA